MSRAVILPDCGDPYVALFWLDFFPRWSGEVDRLYFDLNSPVQSEIVDAIRDEVLRQRGVFSYSPEMVLHGDSIKQTLAKVVEDRVMLIENDAIVFKSGTVDAAFRHLDDGYDIVAGDRCPASATLAEVTRKKFGIADCRHPFFWPNFFITDVARLRRTDQNYLALRWTPGKYIKELDWVAVADHVGDLVKGDTFVWASIQMLAENPRVKILDQYHADACDFTQREQGKNLWDGQAGWLHYGSVSSGYFQILQDEHGVPLMFRDFPNRKSHALNLEFADIHGMFAEYHRRVSWWLLCYETQKDKLKNIVGLNHDYKLAIDLFIDKFGFDRDVAERRTTMYRELLGV